MSRKNTERRPLDPGTAIIPHLTVKELVRLYEAAERDIIAGMALVHGAEQDLDEALSKGGLSGVYITDGYGRRLSYKNSKATLTDLRRQVWRYIIERLDIKRAMSVSAWKDLERQLGDSQQDPPEITEDMVTQMMQQYHRKIPEMVEESIRESYNWLRPRINRYKTNDRFSVGQKVVIENALDSSWSDRFRVNYYYQEYFTALENTFTSLDGKGNKTKNYKSELETAIGETPKSSGAGGETDYFRFKCYRNRNLHLEFKRRDLLLLFNRVAGGTSLKAAMEES